MQRGMEKSSGVPSAFMNLADVVNSPFGQFDVMGVFKLRGRLLSQSH